MESKCHVGITFTFDSVDKLGWRVDIRSHRIKEVIDKILSVWWELFKVFPDIHIDDDDCEECFFWDFVEGL
jgi:lipase ATG15